MYIPKHFALEDRDAIFSLMRQHSFATVVSVADGVPFATHVPVSVRPDLGERGVLRTHVARANPHWRSLEPDRELLVIFQGDHGYVSPRFYEQHPSVPTWNYMTVHAYATPRIVSDDGEVRELLRELVTQYEGAGEAAWDMDALPESYLQGMIGGIVALELSLTRLEGKLKLSQNRSERDRQGVVRALEASPFETERGVAAAMRESRS